MMGKRNTLFTRFRKSIMDWHTICKNTGQTKYKTNIMEEKEQNINEELQPEVEAPVNEESTVDETPAEDCGQEEEKEETPAEPTLEEQIEELKTQMLYKQAEFENFRKRTLKEKADLILNGGEKTVKAILPVLDDFERAVQQAETAEDVTAVKEGMELIFKKFVDILKKMGVEKIETQDVDFNTDLHEAVALVPGMGDDKKGKVIDCVQTGYTLNSKVIRHAKVAVGQ